MESTSLERLGFKTRLSIAKPSFQAWVILGACLLASILSSLRVKQDIENDAVRNFAFICDQITLKIEERLGAYALALRGVSGLFAANGNVDRAGWHAYVETLHASGSIPNLQGIGFSQVIPAHRLTAHVARIRSEGFPKYSVWPPGERPIYTPIVYFEPFRDRNLRTLGFDMFSEPVRRAAMARSRDTGKTTLSGKVELVQETGTDRQAGALMYVPVYRVGMPGSALEARRTSLIGWAYSPYRMQDFMAGILRDWEHRDGRTAELHIYDGGTATPETLLFDSAGADTSISNSLFHQQRTIDFGGRTWRLEFDHVASASTISYADAWITLFGGFTLSGLLFSLGLAATRDRANATRLMDASKLSNRLGLEMRGQEETLLKLSLAVEQSPESIVITDIAGKIEYVNAAFVAVSGYKREEVIGRNPRVLGSGKTPSATYTAMWNALENGQPWKGELFNRRKDGGEYVEFAIVTPIRQPDGRITHFVATKDDITEKKRIDIELAQHRHHLEDLVFKRTAELAVARDRAEAANLAKSHFLANMSHEIRTPMNGVIGMVDILQQTGMSPAQQRMLGTIHNSSLALLRILNDILDYSKIEAGKLAVESISTHLRDVAEGVVLLMINMASGKDAQISLFVDPALPEWILSDPTRLRQILFNLLGNALKFIDHGSGKAMLQVRPVTRQDGTACVQFCVIDNGIGMSGLVVSKLFHPFTQADESTARKFGGTGLGLAITHQLVQLMRGWIHVRSCPGAGSEFSVEFPLHMATAPPGSTLAVEPDITGVQVLAVSAEETCTTLLQAYLGAAGAKVTVVADLQRARQYLQHSHGNPVLVLDVPAESNDDTGNSANQAFDLEWLRGLCVVRLMRRKDRGAPRGRIDVRTGPLLYKDLIHSVAVASGRILADPSADHFERRRSARIPAPSVERAVATRQLILLAEDNPTNLEVMQEQLRILGYTCEVAEDGAVALRMWRSGRYALLLTDCHMPTMDGFELTAAIREAEENGAHLPIIAVTANAMEGEAQRCRERGMDDYMSKPLRLNELGPILAKWLPLPVVESVGSVGSGAIAATEGNGPQDIEAHAAAGLDRNETELFALPIWDATVLTRMVGDNPAMHRRLLEKFLLKAQEQVKRICEAAAIEDAIAVGRVAHAFKSAARTVGALQLGELCQALETAGNAGDATMCNSLLKELPAAFTFAVERINTHLASS